MELSAAAASPRLPTLLALLLALASSVTPLRTVVLDGKLPSYRTIGLPSAVGPESIAFDPEGGGPYTGLSDGRVLKWEGDGRGWREFAIPPRHSGVKRGDCDGSDNITMEDTCGRPLGLQFHGTTGDLYVADAYYGLLVVGRAGGVATQLVTAAEGVPFSMVNGVDVDQQSGMVYFTDSSTQFKRREWLLCFLTGDATGRFMSYNPRTREVKVLLRGLQFANGVALSAHNAFVLVGESVKQRVWRYWLKGPKAGTSELFADLAGWPDNIKRSPAGDFWVAINSAGGSDTGSNGVEGEVVAVAARYSGSGALLEVLDDKVATASSVSEVQETNGTLWLGSVVMPYVGVFRLFQ